MVGILTDTNFFQVTHLWIWAPHEMQRSIQKMRIVPEMLGSKIWAAS